MREFKLVVTNAQTWGNGHSFAEALFQAFKHCSGMRKPTKVKLITYRAEHKGDVFVNEMGALMVTDGAEIDHTFDWEDFDPQVFKSFEDFYQWACDVEFDIEEQEQPVAT